MRISDWSSDGCSSVLDGLPRPPLSLGCPLSTIGFRLIDERGGEGSEGVLQVKTPSMTPGYINRPEATAKLFTAAGWLVTGEVIRQDTQGFYYFVRRADDMFVCGGANIFPAACEAMLETHPDVHKAALVPVHADLNGLQT